MSLPPIIYVSRSENLDALICERKWWLGFGAPNDGDTGVAGWQRRALALPLVTGSYVHLGLASLLKGEGVEAAVAKAREGYRAEVKARGLEVEADAPESYVAQEQAALVEALVRAWARVRLLRWLDEYEVVDVEREERVVLAESEPQVVLLARTDALVRRKSDRALFILNFKTTSDADEKWRKGFEIDAQLMTEALAVEARLGGEKLAGVLVEGIIKGRRQPQYDYSGEEKVVVGRHQASPLIYGYKFDGNPPLEPPSYDWNYTRKKGWHKFAVWNEASFGDAVHASPVAWWVNWLPEETVSAQFETLPPILRDPRRLESKVRQMVAKHRDLHTKRVLVLDEMRGDHENGVQTLDMTFSMNERACDWPTRCPFYDACWRVDPDYDALGVPQGIASSGLYVPRTPNHPEEAR